MTKLQLIIPCFNPISELWAENIITQYELFKRSLPEITIALTIVNDGATKNIDKKYFDYFRTQLPDIQIVSYEKNRGKGFALRQGILNSEADFYLFTDIDFPYENESMVSVTKELLERNGIAVGFRNQNYYQKVPLFRRILSKSFRFFIKMLGIPVQDTQCGLKGFDNEAKKIFLTTTIDRYLFDFEFLYLAAKQKNIPIYHVDVQLKDGIVFSSMGLNVLRTEAWNLLKVLVLS
jgi:glycosyltransferase involved in cell wall biosynthesis